MPWREAFRATYGLALDDFYPAFGEWLEGELLDWPDTKTEGYVYSYSRGTVYVTGTITSGPCEYRVITNS